MRRIGILLCSLLLTFLVLGGCTIQNKQSIRLGASRSLTGPNEIFEKSAFGPIYKMWIDEVNADGGIFVKEYGKKLPIETIIYDDKSDLNIMAKNIEKLITEDKVDLLLPPIGTGALFTAAPIFNKYKYLLIGAEGGASKIKEIISGLPYFYSLLSFSDHNQVPALVDLLNKKGVKKVGIIFISDLHGTEYSGVATPLLKEKGIDVVSIKSIPIGIKDVSPILKEMKTENVEALLSFTYPDESFLVVKQSIETGFNPKAFLIGPGGNFGIFPKIFGLAAEGVMCFGAWNSKVSPEHKVFADKLIKLYGEQAIDWWGHNLYYAGLQFLQQAIEKAGTLDQEKIQAIFATEKFDTILGQTWFDNNHLLATACHSGEVGQWQNGVFEVVAPDEKVTASLIYPKPAWPR